MKTLQDSQLRSQLQLKSDQLNGLPDLAAMVVKRDDLELSIARAERRNDQREIFRCLRVKHRIDQDIDRRYTAMVAGGTFS